MDNKKEKELLSVIDRDEKNVFNVTKPPFSYDGEGQKIIDSEGKLWIDIRGWGVLNRYKNGAQMQDDFGSRVAELLNSCSTVTKDEKVVSELPCELPKIYKTNDALGYAEYALFVIFPNGDGLCIEFQRNSNSDSYQLGEITPKEELPPNFQEVESDLYECSLYYDNKYLMRYILKKEFNYELKVERL